MSEGLQMRLLVPMDPAQPILEVIRSSVQTSQDAKAKTRSSVCYGEVLHFVAILENPGFAQKSSELERWQAKYSSLQMVVGTERRENKMQTDTSDLPFEPLTPVAISASTVPTNVHASWLTQDVQIAANGDLAYPLVAHTSGMSYGVTRFSLVVRASQQYTQQYTQQQQQQPSIPTSDLAHALSTSSLKLKGSTKQAELTLEVVYPPHVFCYTSTIETRQHVCIQIENHLQQEVMLDDVQVYFTHHSNLRFDKRHPVTRTSSAPSVPSAVDDQSQAHNQRHKPIGRSRSTKLPRMAASKASDGGLSASLSPPADGASPSSTLTPTPPATVLPSPSLLGATVDGPPTPVFAVPPKVTLQCKSADPPSSTTTPGSTGVAMAASIPATSHSASAVTQAPAPSTPHHRRAISYFPATSKFTSFLDAATSRKPATAAAPEPSKPIPVTTPQKDSFLSSSVSAGTPIPFSASQLLSGLTSPQTQQQGKSTITLANTPQESTARLNLNDSLFQPDFEVELGPIMSPTFAEDHSHAQHEHDHESDLCQSDESHMFLQEFLSKLSIDPIGPGYPVQISPSTRQAFVFVMEIPSNVSLPLSATEFSLQADKQVSSESTASRQTRESTSTGDGNYKDHAFKAFLDAFVSVKWRFAAMTYPISCQYRFSRASVIVPRFVVCAFPTSPCITGQPISLQFSLLNCTSSEVDVSLVINQPTLVDRQNVGKHASSMLQHVTHDDGQAGLVCLDKQLHIGSCFPNIVQTVTVTFQAFHAGLYDISDVLILEQESSLPVPFKFIGNQVMVSH